MCIYILVYLETLLCCVSVRKLLSLLLHLSFFPFFSLLLCLALSSLFVSLPPYLLMSISSSHLYTGGKLLGFSTYPSEFVFSSLLGRLHFKEFYFLLPHIFNLYVPWYPLLDLLSFHSRPVFLNLERS